MTNLTFDWQISDFMIYCVVCPSITFSILCGSMPM